jgi:hypothetical protein
VTLLGLALRWGMVETLPLGITPDATWYPNGRGYLVWALEILDRGDFDGPPLRTPGYPALLASAFALGGVRDASVLGLQHLAGLVTVGLLTLVAARRAGPRVALATGVLATLDPWHLLFSHYALTETSAALFGVMTAAAILLPRARSLGQGVAVGLLAGATCLVRPSSQLLVPFFGAAYLLAPWGARHGVRASARAGASASALALGLALSLGPWLAFNAVRGIEGLAVQRESLLFVPMVFHRLLDARDMPADTPEAVRLGFGSSDAERADPEFADRFLRLCGKHELPYEVRESWSRASLARNRARYPGAVWDSLRTLLNVGALHQPPIRDELLGLVVRITREPRGSALLLNGLAGALPTPASELPPALEARVGAAFRSAFDLASWLSGWPQLFLALAASAALALCLRSRLWREAAVLAGALGFVLFHALILYPHQRFTLPSAMLWYLSIPFAIEALRGRRDTGLRAQLDRPAAGDAA